MAGVLVCHEGRSCLSRRAVRTPVRGFSACLGPLSVIICKRVKFGFPQCLKISLLASLLKYFRIWCERMKIVYSKNLLFLPTPTKIF